MHPDVLGRSAARTRDWGALARAIVSGAAGSAVAVGILVAGCSAPTTSDRGTRSPTTSASHSGSTSWMRGSPGQQPPPPQPMPDDFRPVVRGSFPQIDGCYRQALASNSTLRGTIVLAFTVDPEGHVVDAGFDGASTLRDSALGACVFDVLRSLTFPKREEATVTQFPVALMP